MVPGWFSRGASGWLMVLAERLKARCCVAWARRGRERWVEPQRAAADVVAAHGAWGVGGSTWCLGSWWQHMVLGVRVGPRLWARGAGVGG